MKSAKRITIILAICVLLVWIVGTMWSNWIQNVHMTGMIEYIKKPGITMTADAITKPIMVVPMKGAFPTLFSQSTTYISYLLQDGRCIAYISFSFSGFQAPSVTIIHEGPELLETVENSIDGEKKIGIYAMGMETFLFVEGKVTQMSGISDLNGEKSANLQWITNVGIGLHDLEVIQLAEID